jgi:hypothetical protein
VTSCTLLARQSQSSEAPAVWWYMQIAGIPVIGFNRTNFCYNLKLTITCATRIRFLLYISAQCCKDDLINWSRSRGLPSINIALFIALVNRKDDQCRCKVHSVSFIVWWTLKNRQDTFLCVPLLSITAYFVNVLLGNTGIWETLKNVTPAVDGRTRPRSNLYCPCLFAVDWKRSGPFILSSNEAGPHGTNSYASAMSV